MARKRKEPPLPPGYAEWPANTDQVVYLRPGEKVDPFSKKIQVQWTPERRSRAKKRDASDTEPPPE